MNIDKKRIWEILDRLLRRSNPAEIGSQQSVMLFSFVLPFEHTYIHTDNHSLSKFIFFFSLSLSKTFLFVFVLSSIIIFVSFLSLFCFALLSVECLLFDRLEKQLEGNWDVNMKCSRAQPSSISFTLSTIEPGTIALTTTPVDLFPLIPKPRPDPSLVSSITSICVHNVFN